MPGMAWQRENKMKKAVSILLTVAMCMGMLVAIVPTVSATEPDPTPSGAVYYEENFNDPSYAALVDSDLAAALGWSAPNQYQTMLIQDGKLRIVAQYTPGGVKNSAGWANDNVYRIVTDPRISKGATVIEYKFTYQDKRGQDDVTVTRASDSVTKTVKNDGQALRQYAAFTSVDGTGYWQCPVLPTGQYDCGRSLYDNGWKGDTFFKYTNATYAPTAASYTYDYMDDPTAGTTTGASIMGAEHTMKILVDPDIAGISVWLDGTLVTYMNRDNGQAGTWIASEAAAVITDTIGLHVQPGMDILIDDVKIYSYVPELVISELCIYAKEGGDSYGNGRGYLFNWAEVTNTSDYAINVFDYALFQDHTPQASATNGKYNQNFTADWDKDVAFLYPGEHSFGAYSRSYTNPSYEEGVLQPGESAMIVIPKNDYNGSSYVGQPGVSMKTVKECEVYYWGQTAGSEIKTFYASSDNDFNIWFSGGWFVLGVTKVTNTGSDNAGNYTPVAEMSKGRNGQLGNLESMVLLNYSDASGACWGIGANSTRCPTNAFAYTQSIEIGYWNADGGSRFCGQLKYTVNQTRGSRNATHSLGEVPEDIRRNVWVSVEGVNGAKTNYKGTWGVAFDLPAAAEVPDYRFEGYSFNAGTVTGIAADDMKASEIAVQAIYKTVLPTYVGYQVSDVSEGKYSVRFVASINYLDDVSSVGFIIRAQYTKDAAPVDKTVTQYCSYVYTSILAGGNSVTAEELGGNYVFALHIDDIPTDVGAITFTVTPYYRVGESDVIESVAQTVVIG